MKGMERITTVRLAEILSQDGSVQNDQITDALYHQDQTGLPFVELLIESGDVSEWDIAKIVVQHFQLPFLMTTNLDIDRKAVELLPEDFLFEHRVVPFMSCGGVLSLAMPILVPFKVLTQAQNLSGLEIFPFVGLTSENRKILRDIYPEHVEEDRSSAAAAASGEADGEELSADSSWENIFDIGDEQVLKDLDK
jgi:hypothetical protein